MPVLRHMKDPDGKSASHYYVWSVSKKVGLGANTHGLDVKLGQWLLWKYVVLTKKTGNIINNKTDIDGQWGQKSNRTIRKLEDAYKDDNLLIADGTFSVMPEGQIYVPMTEKLYKMFLMNKGYVKMHSSAPEGVPTTQSEWNSVILAMPEHPDMPPDLGAALRTVRDSDPFVNGQGKLGKTG